HGAGPPGPPDADCRRLPSRGSQVAGRPPRRRRSTADAAAVLCGTTVLHLGHGRQLSPHQLTKGLRGVQSELLVYDGRLPLHRSVLTADGYRSRRWNGTSPDSRETDAAVAGVEYPEIN